MRMDFPLKKERYLQMAPDDEDVTNNNLKAATKRKLYFVYPQKLSLPN